MRKRTKREPWGLQRYEPPVQTPEVAVRTLAEAEARTNAATERAQDEADALAEEIARVTAEAEAARNALLFWPEDKPMPKRIERRPRQVIPCPRCRRVRLDSLKQAVVCCSSGGPDGYAYFRCRACEHRFRLEVAGGKR